MNHEAALRIQAWVDGELPSPAAREVAAWVERDPDAAALATELRHARSALREGEPEYSAPVSREFYWSAIERRIASRQTPQPQAPAPPPFAWLVRWFVPAGILAALALVLALPALRDQFAPPVKWASEEVESPLDDISSVTFRSESEGITVVWVNAR